MWYMLEELIFSFLIFGLPGIAALFFLVCLVRTIYANLKREKNPESFTEKEVSRRKKWLIISIIILAIPLSIALGIAILLSMAVAYM